MSFKIKNIKWDTDGDMDALYDLPKELEFPNEKFETWLSKFNNFSIFDYEDEEEYLDDISDYLSDEYGFCHDGFKVEGEVIEKKNFMVEVSDTATYCIRAKSMEEAQDLAWDYFQEREPNFNISVTDEEAEVEI